MTTSTALPEGATLVDHPLIRVRLSKLRNSATGVEEFRKNLHDIGALMLFEATKNLPTAENSIQTPLATTTGYQLRRPLVLVPILRAGLGLLHSILAVLPEAKIGHIGLARNEKTLEPETYYENLPSDIGAADILLIDPMLATGHSSVAAIDRLKELGAKRITFLSLVSCRQGIDEVLEKHPDVPLFTAAVDSELNEHGYIVPGLGDAGDRYFGTS